jgi:hypothetical protein
MGNDSLAKAHPDFDERLGLLSETQDKIHTDRRKLADSRVRGPVFTPGLDGQTLYRDFNFY